MHPRGCRLSVPERPCVGPRPNPVPTSVRLFGLDAPYTASGARQRKVSAGGTRAATCLREVIPSLAKIEDRCARAVRREM